MCRQVFFKSNSTLWSQIFFLLLFFERQKFTCFKYIVRNKIYAGIFKKIIKQIYIYIIFAYDLLQLFWFAMNYYKNIGGLQTLQGKK